MYAHKINRGVFNAAILSNQRTSHGFYNMTMEMAGPAAGAFAGACPGQFAEIDVSGAPLPRVSDIPPDLVDAAGRGIILRRPFSFTDVVIQGGTCRIGILYCVVGAATVRMTALRTGETIGVIGPLGNGFSIPDGKKTALLVAGGMGAPPLQHLAKVLSKTAPAISVTALAGARTASMLPFTIDPGRPDVLAEFARCGIDSRLCTDDGSIGLKGPVTELLAQYLSRAVDRSETIIYACGPEAMLTAVATVAARFETDCQVSMERRMACGTGLCQGCAVECRVPGSDRTIYRLCCKDGPVFDAREVVFSK